MPVDSRPRNVKAPPRRNSNAVSSSTTASYALASLTGVEIVTVVANRGS